MLLVSFTLLMKGPMPAKCEYRPVVLHSMCRLGIFDYYRYSTENSLESVSVIEV